MQNNIGKRAFELKLCDLFSYIGKDFRLFQQKKNK